jgi:glucose/arabinose dehydrogenase
MVRAGTSKMWAVVVAAMVASMVVALVCLEVEPARSATSVPTCLTDSVVAQVNKPTSMTVAPDGRLFVTQKASNNVGKVRVIKNAQLLSKPFLKLNTDTSYFRGVLGITLDPNFSSNHYVYVFYTATSPTVHNRVSRFTPNGDVAVAGSEKVIIDLPTLGTTGGHYGGSLRFGTDGNLYVGGRRWSSRRHRNERRPVAR